MISTFFGSFIFNGFCYFFMKIVAFFIQIVQKITKMMKKHTKNQNHNLHFFDFPTPLISQKTIIFIFSNFLTFFAFFLPKIIIFHQFCIKSWRDTLQCDTIILCFLIMKDVVRTFSSTVICSKLSTAGPKLLAMLLLRDVLPKKHTVGLNPGKIMKENG